MKNQQNKIMMKNLIEEILKNFDEKFLFGVRYKSNLSVITDLDYHKKELTELKQFLSQSLDQIRQSTIKEILEKLPKEIDDEKEMDSSEAIKLLQQIFGYSEILNDLNYQRIGFNKGVQECKNIIKKS